MWFGILEIVQNAKELSSYLYKHPLVRYIVVGGSTFALDLLILITLHSSLGLGLALATTVAYWIAIAYNFTLNRFWTFSIAEKQSLHKHLASYLVLLGVNYVFTLLFVSLLSKHIYFGTAKALAVIIQITWTYKVYKDYIFIK